MAKRPANVNPTQHRLPESGQAFLMPLADGRFGVCRVLRRSTEDEQIFHGAPSVLVAASSWIGADRPEVADRRLRDILVLTHHSWESEPQAIWTTDPLPDTFKLLGVIEPTPDEQRMQCHSFSSWLTLPLQVLLQWRWENDREAVLREDEQQQEEEARERANATERRKKYLSGLTLSKLRRKRRLSGWNGYVPDKIIRACRINFRDTIDALIQLGPKPKKRDVLRVLQTCIKRFNQLDETNGHFIETIAREDLCDEFDEIVYAAGLKDCEDLADRWREW